jgi:TRAP-type C4-dicarboxylate transport system permease small subunit
MGVRDKTHMSVSVIYNRFKKGGAGRKRIDFFVDLCILTCGLFMLYFGGLRCIKMMGLAGSLPMTGLKTWWQFLPIPLAGFLITFDSILYLTHVLKPGDVLFSEPEKDAAEIYSESLQEEAALTDGADIEAEAENALRFASSDKDKKDGDAP